MDSIKEFCKSIGAGILTLSLFVGVGYFVYTSLFNLKETPSVTPNFASLSQHQAYICDVKQSPDKDTELGRAIVAPALEGCDFWGRYAYTLEKGLRRGQQIIVVDYQGDNYAVTADHSSLQKK